MIDLKNNLKALINDPIRKIFAITFAVGLWLFVAMDDNYVFQKETRIIYTGLADSLIITDSVSTLPAVFWGRGSYLFNLWLAPPKLRCNIDNVQLGRQSIPVNKLIYAFPFGDINITYDRVTEISIAIDEKDNRIIPISIPYIGALKEGLSVKEIIVLDTVEATGSKQILQDMENIPSETLYIKKQTSSFREVLKLNSPSPLVLLSINKVRVEVQLDTTNRLIITNIPLKLIYTTNQRVVSEKISLDTLIVEGPQSRLEALEKRAIIVKITLTGLPNGDYDLPATIILPEYIKPVYSKPKRFKISIF
ncbi:hypothetical protein A2Y85_03605 [candidate division WOR-3 bacterium RBG_13_43_14]|uniref:YbbR-like domain-containing protein n=1 Tax=candidate division WOR-3 bacterium RBG_13_43_14 TaxID=1802590 RepID=A0A1F4U1S4_UNCW3|nr:MAG: hypothetical protein A2Y85_03605 [candidate division WOR-3 bacterium RBG_13_43_14]